MSTFTWGAFGQQGLERQQRDDELAKQRQARRREVDALRARIPAWEDGVKQLDAKLVEARAAHVAARDATARAWDALVRGCYVRQAGACAFSPQGEPIADANHPAVAHLNAAWQEAQAAESRAAARISKLEAEKQYYAGWIGTARATT